jgi:hypothetical protein
MIVEGNGRSVQTHARLPDCQVVCCCCCTPEGRCDYCITFTPAQSVSSSHTCTYLSVTPWNLTNPLRRQGIVEATPRPVQPQHIGRMMPIA